MIIISPPAEQHYRTISGCSGGLLSRGFQRSFGVFPSDADPHTKVKLLPDIATGSRRSFASASCGLRLAVPLVRGRRFSGSGLFPPWVCFSSAPIGALALIIVDGMVRLFISSSWRCPSRHAFAQALSTSSQVERLWVEEALYQFLFRFYRVRHGSTRRVIMALWVCWASSADLAAPLKPRTAASSGLSASLTPRWWRIRRLLKVRHIESIRIERLWDIVAYVSGTTSPINSWTVVTPR
jgi:hypothetical protein